MANWTWELLAGPDSITEGPAWDGTGLLFTSIDHSEIRRFDPATGNVSVVHRNTNETNGLYLGPDGSLYGCEHASGMVVRYDTTGSRSVLASQWDGKRLNAPNDLVLDSQGRIWFTDPRYGSQDGRELDHCSVYRLTPNEDGSTPWQIERLTYDTTRPNGLLLSPDERTLYVANSDFLPGSIRQLRAYSINTDGTLDDHSVLYDFGDARGIDGMCWDTDGNFVATCGWELSGPGPRIAVFATDGTLLEEHPTPAGNPTNCVFGGPELTNLYITTLSGHLYRVADTGRRGILQPPGTSPFVG